jgi:glycosyltransferase involved in cell wall biosynthesis
VKVLIGRAVAKLELGGAQLSLLRVARALAARGHQTRLLAGNATPDGVALAHAYGLQVQVMGSDSDLQWTCDPAFARWLAPRLTDVDLIHAHMLGAWWAAATVADSTVPLIASEHNGYEWNQQPPWAAMADVAERIDVFYAHGPDARAGALRIGVSADRIRRGVSPVVGMRTPPRPGLPSPRIMFTGRLSPDKAPDVLIDAVARMAAPPPVMVLGTGAMDDDLRAQVVRLGLQRTVTFHGWVDDPGAWVAGASAQACPSRDEAFSQTAVLAMGLGVPVVGTDVDGFPETLADGRGVIVAPEDPDALATALEQILAGRSRPNTGAARTWARQFETERIATLYEQAYSGAIEPGAPELAA